MSLQEEVDLLPAYEYSREPRSLSFKEMLDCEKETWSLLLAAPVKWITISILVTAGIWVGAHIPIIGFILFLFFMFLLFAGVSYCCHKQTVTGDFDLKDFFIAFRGEGASLSIIAIIFSITFFIMMIFSYMIGDVLNVYKTLEPFLYFEPYIPSGEELLNLLAWGLVLTLASCGTFMGSAFVPQLVLLRRVDPIKSVASSFMACWNNLSVLFVCFIAHFGLIVISLLLYGIPLLVLIPMFLVHWFCVFRKIYEVR